MQEAAAAHEAFAGVLAIDDVVDRREIGLAVALAAFGGGILPRIGLRILHPLRRRRMRGQEVLRARIERGAAGLHRSVALHRGEKARGTKGIEMRACGNADADAVGLEFLRPREACHCQLGFCQSERAQIGIAAHLGDDARHHRGLAGLLLADRGVPGQHMRHLVRQHRGQFGRVGRQCDQAARDIELAGRQREGVDRAGIQDRDLIGQIGPLGRGDQAIDGLADQRFQPGVIIGAAIGGENPLMLLLASRGLHHGRFRRRRGRLARAERLRGGFEPADIAAAGQGERQAQQNRRSPTAAAQTGLPSLTRHVASSCPVA